MDQNYLADLLENQDWLPGINQLLAAFSLPITQIKYILFGESPYPRVESANGFAFWDASVTEIWSETGLSKSVNRATSLRNFIKMLLVAEQKLSSENLSQSAIVAINKRQFCQTLSQLFANFQRHGFLLLNASLALSMKNKNQEAKYWLPFLNSLLTTLRQLPRQQLTLLLFGKIAERIKVLDSCHHFPQLIAEHPYNLTFINNQQILQFFAPLKLLDREDIAA